MKTPTPLEQALDIIEQIETFAVAQQACPSLSHQQGLRQIELMAKMTSLALARTDHFHSGPSS